MHDRRGVAVRDAVLVAQPVHALVEAEQAGPVVEGLEPLGQVASGDLWHPLDQLLVGCLGVVQGHRRLQCGTQRTMASRLPHDSASPQPPRARVHARARTRRYARMPDEPAALPRAGRRRRRVCRPAARRCPRPASRARPPAPRPAGRADRAAAQALAAVLRRASRPHVDRRRRRRCRSWPTSRWRPAGGHRPRPRRASAAQTDGPAQAPGAPSGRRAGCRPGARRTRPMARAPDARRRAASTRSGRWPTCGAGSSEASAQALEDHGHALAAADAHRLEAELLVVALQAVEQRVGDPGAGRAERVARARSRRRAR